MNQERLTAKDQQTAPLRLCCVYSGESVKNFLKVARLEIRLLLLSYWRARRDLNPQPSDPKSDALSS